jgi:NagD protein
MSLAGAGVTTEQLLRIRHVALDMDGTIYKGSVLFDFTPSFLAMLRDLKIGYTFLTNNSSKSVKDYVRHLQKMGIEATPDQIFTSQDSTIVYLREKFPSVRRLFILGTPSLQEHFANAGFENSPDEEKPELVIVGFHTALPYERLCKAGWWIKCGVPYIATHPDYVCPTDQPTLLVDCGAVTKCLESATGVAPQAVLGKPDYRMLTGIMEKYGLNADELAMCGDRLYTDMEMARRSGAMGVLVLTGESTAADAEYCEYKPDVVIASLEQFGEMLAHAKRSNQ